LRLIGIMKSDCVLLRTSGYRNEAGELFFVRDACEQGPRRLE
jgi:hypothetical protein